MIQTSNNKYINNAKNIKYFFSDVDGTLTNGLCYYSRIGEELKTFNFKDGTGFLLLKKLGIKTGIITGENSEIVIRRGEKLKLDYCFINVKDKLEFLNAFAIKNNVTLQNFAYIGDDLNDLGLIKKVGISFCPLNSVDLIKKNVNLICPVEGGNGALRWSVEKLIEYLEKDVEKVFSL